MSHTEPGWPDLSCIPRASKGIEANADCISPSLEMVIVTHFTVASPINTNGCLINWSRVCLIEFTGHDTEAEVLLSQVAGWIFPAFSSALSCCFSSEAHPFLTGGRALLLSAPKENAPVNQAPLL